ncbi:MAG: cation:proton antiporter [Candidatus Eutrophobiaceae bacterium]
MSLPEFILVLASLLTISMLMASLSRSVPIPFTVLLVILGFCLVQLAKLRPELAPLLWIKLTPDIIFFVFLPGLIFESSFNLDARQLLRDIAPIMVLAVPALLISTFLVAFGLHATLGMGFLVALLFGALISATDPVAVISLFKELGVSKRLSVLVEGESLLNDATAIVLFHVLLGLFTHIGTALDAGAIGGAIWQFVRVFVGGVCVGAIMGAVISLLLFRPKAGLPSFLVMSIVLAYASFAVAEHIFHVSGVISVMTAAIVLNALGGVRISGHDMEILRESWEVIAVVCNSLLFLFVGFTVDLHNMIAQSGSIMIAIACVLCARAATVYTMVPATVKLFNIDNIGWGERHIMWWGALKGGLAIAIVLSIPDSLPEKSLLFDLTIGVVLFSLLVNATTVKPFINMLGINKLNETEQMEMQHALIKAENHTSELLRRFQKTMLISERSAQDLMENLHQRLQHLVLESSPEIEQREELLKPLRMELEELKHLYEVGLLPYYTYLGMKAERQHDRDSWAKNPRKFHHQDANSKHGLLKRVEAELLKRLRELDWASGLLLHYQHLRMSQDIRQDIASILVYADIRDWINNNEAIDEKARNYLVMVYNNRIKLRRNRLYEIQEEFPDFYLSFELSIMSKLTLMSADLSIATAYKHGEIGNRVHSTINSRITDALSTLPTVSHAGLDLQLIDMLDHVPLLHGLSPELIARIAKIAKPATFLKGDVIIGEGERGDSLYILLRGGAEVHKKGQEQPIAELSEGDFMGEMALLGEPVRTASVYSTSFSTLLRLTRRSIFSLAEKHSELKSRLEHVKRQRSVSIGNSTTSDPEGVDAD